MQHLSCHRRRRFAAAPEAVTDHRSILHNSCDSIVLTGQITTQPRENTHSCATGPHARATLIDIFFVFARKILIFYPFSILFSPTRPKHLNHSNYTWKHGFIVQNNLTHHSKKMTYLTNVLKNDFYSKTSFSPKWFLTKTHWLKTEIPIILIHHDNSINSFKFIQIKLL